MLLSSPNMFELFNDLLHPFLSRFVTNYLSLKTRHHNYRLDKNGTPNLVRKKFFSKESFRSNIVRIKFVLNLFEITFNERSL
jgi:hypothetical protein